jgi:S-adenosylmethionine decarboxylase
MDHNIWSIRQFIEPSLLAHYMCGDKNLTRQRIWTTRMLIKERDIDEHLFGSSMDNYDPEFRRYVKRLVGDEMRDIYFARNVN